MVPSPGLCHQWEMVMTQGMTQCSKWRVAPGLSSQLMQTHKPHGAEVTVNLGTAMLELAPQSPPGLATVLPTSGTKRLGPYRGAEPFHVRLAGSKRS